MQGLLHFNFGKMSGNHHHNQVLKLNITKNGTTDILNSCYDVLGDTQYHL